MTRLGMGTGCFSSDNRGGVRPFVTRRRLQKGGPGGWAWNRASGRSEGEGATDIFSGAETVPPRIIKGQWKIRLRKDVFADVQVSPFAWKTKHMVKRFLQEWQQTDRNISQIVVCLLGFVLGQCPEEDSSDKPPSAMGGVPGSGLN